MMVETTNADMPECPTCGSELCPKCGCPTSGGPGEGCMTEHEVRKTMDSTMYRIYLQKEIDHLKTRIKYLECVLQNLQNILGPSVCRCEGMQAEVEYALETIRDALKTVD